MSVGDTRVCAFCHEAASVPPAGWRITKRDMHTYHSIYRQRRQYCGYSKVLSAVLTPPDWSARDI